MAANACPDCGQGYRSGAGHCRGGKYGGCCRSFRGTLDFDRHRTGPHDGARRCRTDAELLDAHWVKTDYPLPDLWASPRTQQILERYQNGADRMYVFGSGEEAQDLAQFTTSDESATDGKRT